MADISKLSPLTEKIDNFGKGRETIFGKGDSKRIPFTSFVFSFIQVVSCLGKITDSCYPLKFGNRANSEDII